MSGRDGGPAFPGAGEYLDAQDEERTPEPGMDLRDYFAGQALAGILNHYYNDDTAIMKGSDHDYVRDAYGIADAMLEERERDR